MTVCAGVCALSATAATQWVADSFEAPEGAVDMGIVQYKWIIDGGNITTNWQTSTSGNDQSKLVATEGAYAGDRPITNVAADLVLKLETNGDELKRVLDGGVTKDFVAGDPVYVDTLIKFTPSETAPDAFDPAVKAAVFVNAVSNLAVYSGIDGLDPDITDLGIAIDPAQWYRLTIKLGKLGESFPVFQIFLDGNVISNAVACELAGESIQYGTGLGTYFNVASAETTLSAVSFTGTGFVDELVVTDTVNLGGPASILLTLAFNDTLVSVTQGGVPVANNGTVETGTEIVIDAADWYEITSVTGAGDGAFSGTVGALVNVVTGLVSATANDTLTISAAQYSSGSIATGLGGGSLPADKVAAWATAQVPPLGEGALTSGMLDDYLLNVAPDTNADLEITSIVLNGDDTATITVAANNAAVDFTALNGTLVVETSEDLSAGEAGFGNPSETLFTVDAETLEATIVVQYSAGNFIRAVVK